jgi:hypothetical protein
MPKQLPTAFPNPTQIVIKVVIVADERPKGVSHWIRGSLLPPDCQLGHAGDFGVLIVPAWFAKLAKLTSGARADADGY